MLYIHHANMPMNLFIDIVVYRGLHFVFLFLLQNQIMSFIKINVSATNKYLANNGDIFTTLKNHGILQRGVT